MLKLYLPIIHRYIKASNILTTNTLRAKVSNRDNNQKGKQ